jgi:hypothetical protein
VNTFIRKIQEVPRRQNLNIWPRIPMGKKSGMDGIMKLWYFERGNDVKQRAVIAASQRFAVTK